MGNFVKMAACLGGSYLWARSMENWAPHTVAGLFIALTPSVVLALLGAFFALRARFPQLFR